MLRSVLPSTESTPPAAVFKRLRAAGFALIMALIGGTALPAAAAGEPTPALMVSADAESVTLTLAQAPDGPIRVHALSAHEAEDAAERLVFTGTVSNRKVTLPRKTDGRDLLFCRFLITNEKDQPLSPPQWVTGFTEPTGDATSPMPWPKEIKGVSNPEDFDDLVALGVRHVHVNFKLGNLFLPANAADPAPEFIRQSHGQRLRFNPKVIRQWDTDLTRMTNDGINVVAVILNPLNQDRGSRELLIHPDTDVANAPFKLGAFNITNDAATAHFVGAMSFLAERYSRADKKHGWLGGYIIGNEVDSHWTWHNLGEADLETIARHYAKEVRLAWLAIRQHHPDPGVFVSLTHSWARPNSRAELKNCAGKDLLVRLTELSRAGGDFGWDVAYHPYPQNLFEPRFWNDQMAMFGYDSPMITFKNIEVLPAFLNRPDMTYHQEPRRVIFSEQGFHTPEGKDGERVQAAAFALAYHRIRQTPGIDAFILHRHVDVEGEGGLLLGVRGLSPGPGKLGKKKRSWQVFRATETDSWDTAARFALKEAGYKSWADADPRPGPFPERAAEWDSFQTRQGVVFDLLEKLDEAEVENALVVKQRLVGLMDGGMAESLLLHPLGPDQPAATATYRVQLPAAEQTALQFQTYLGKPQSGGVVFRVRVDGELLFEQEVKDQTIREHSVDLSASAGKTVRLTLEVACGKNNSHDAAEWLTPAVVKLR